MIRRLLLFSCAALLAVSVLAAPAMAGTAVPGHDPAKFPNRIDKDGNGISDEGVMVNGHYTSYYYEDANGDWYWDLGDGRIYTSSPAITSVGDLNQLTLSTCDYVNNYRASFENDPFMDYGSIHNNIRCYGFDGNEHYKYLIVHESDPRYTGNPAWSIWGTWEYQALNVSGEGNTLRFSNPQYPH